MIRKLKGLFWIWKQCIKSMRNLKTFIPFMFYAIIQLFLLYVIVNFFKSPFSYFMIPLILNLFGESALHYPYFFYFITPLFNQFNLLISGLLGIIMIGMATQIFAASFNAQQAGIRTAFVTTLHKYAALFILWLIETIFTMAVVLGIPFILKMILQADSQMSHFIELGTLLMGIFITSIFAFTTAYVIIENQSVVLSISNTLTIFRKNTITTFFLVAIPTLVYFPINYIAGKTDFIISKFSPEIIVFILAAGVVITFFTNYIQIGSITRLFLLKSKKQH